MSGDAHGKEDEKEKKKKLPEKLLTVGLGIFALILFFAVTSAAIPEVINQLSSTVNNTGSSLNGLGRSVQNFSSGAGYAMRALLVVILVALITYLIGKEVLKLLQNPSEKKKDEHKKDDHANDGAKKDAPKDGKKDDHH
jgi:predicted metalloprotease